MPYAPQGVKGTDDDALYRSTGLFHKYSCSEFGT
jgi:hypothetical protein